MPVISGAGENPKELRPQTEAQLWKQAFHDLNLNLLEAHLAEEVDAYRETGQFHYDYLARMHEAEPFAAEYLTQGLLAAAAKRDDLAAFCELLDHVPRAGFTRRAPSYGPTEGETPGIMGGVFITEKPAFLEEIIKRFGFAGVKDAMYRYCPEPDMEDWIITNLPEPWLAVMLRNLPLTRFFHAHGAYGDGTPVIEEGTTMSLYTCVWNKPWSKYTGFSDRVVTNLYHAAQLSCSTEMLQWVMEHFPHLTPKSPPDLTRITLAVAVERHDPLALAAYMEAAAAEGRDVNADFLTPLYISPFCEINRPVPGEEKARFFSMAFDCFTEERVRQRLLTALLTVDPFPGIQRLVEMYADAITDVGPVLLVDWNYKRGYRDDDYYHHLRVSVLRRQADGKDPRCLIDWYAFSKKKAEWHPELACTDFVRVARLVRPREIRRQADPILSRVVLSGNPALVEFAIRQGFITDRNAPFLRRLPGVSREITVMLMGLEPDVPMDTLYDL